MLTTWQQALDFLYDLANWETRPPGTLPTFELDRMRRVLGALDDPHTRWRAVHVGGTNGKGSTCATVAAALTAAGLRVGLYTSPHLHTVRERIKIDGRLVRESQVLEWLNRNASVLEREPGLTTFEALTAMAFGLFADEGVDATVVEVGLGGRLDSTNVVTSDVTVITPIGLDHTDVLGETVDLIAEDKCGIFREGVPIVSAPQSVEALEVIESSAVSLGSVLTLVGRDVSWTASGCRLTGRDLAVTVIGKDGDRTYEAETRLMAPYSIVNAVTATAALDVLIRLGWPLTGEAVERGLAAAEWPARFEVLGDGPTVVIDAAHNTDGAEALLAALAECFGECDRHFILGASRGKNVEGFVRRVLPSAASVVAARADHPRAWPAGELAEVVSRLGGSALACESPSEALETAMISAGGHGIVVATGSLFLAADVREAWLTRAGWEPPPSDPPKIDSQRALG